MGRNALDALGQQITDAEWLTSPRLIMPTIRLLLLITGSLRTFSCLHVMHRLCEVIVLAATMDAFGHHIARRRAAGIEAVARKPFADDVAVGHHPDQSVVLPDRNAADVMPRINFASSVTGVSGLTQSTPLCITSLTFMADLRCWISGGIPVMQNSFPLGATIRQIGKAGIAKAMTTS